MIYSLSYSYLKCSLSVPVGNWIRGVNYLKCSLHDPVGILDSRC